MPLIQPSRHSNAKLLGVIFYLNFGEKYYFRVLKKIVSFMTLR